MAQKTLSETQTKLSNLQCPHSSEIDGERSAKRRQSGGDVLTDWCDEHESNQYPYSNMNCSKYEIIIGFVIKQREMKKNGVGESIRPCYGECVATPNLP